MYVLITCFIHLSPMSYIYLKCYRSTVHCFLITCFIHLPPMSYISLKYPFYLILIILELELLLLLAKVEYTNCVLKFRKAPSPKLQRELSWKLLWFQKNKKGTFFMKPTGKPLDAGAGKVLDMDTWQSIRPEANLWMNEMKSRLVHVH